MQCSAAMLLRVSQARMTSLSSFGSKDRIVRIVRDRTTPYFLYVRNIVRVLWWLPEGRT